MNNASKADSREKSSLVINDACKFSAAAAFVNAAKARGLDGGSISSLSIKIASSKGEDFAIEGLGNLEVNATCKD